MKIQVIRKVFDEVSTIGDFMVDGEYFCKTLERPWQNGANAHGLSCILPGTYQVIVDFSPHFNGLMPHILNVPGRSEIRIHPANWPSQLEGCIALGETATKDAIENSVHAFRRFFILLEPAVKEGQVFIEVSNAT